MFAAVFATLGFSNRETERTLLDTVPSIVNETNEKTIQITVSNPSHVKIAPVLFFVFVFFFFALAFRNESPGSSIRDQGPGD